MSEVWIHLGLPKCGSTAFQDGLVANASILHQAGWHYAPTDAYFSNHFAIYDAISRGDRETCVGFLKDMKDAMRAEGRDKLLVSSEEFVILGSTEKLQANFAEFLDSVRTIFDVSPAFVAMHRPLDGFLRSYLFQLCANGVMLSYPSQRHLPGFFSACLDFFRSLGRLELIDAQARKGRVLQSFFDIADPRVTGLEERHLNVGRSHRFLDIAVGNSVRASAGLDGTHVNGPEADHVRRRLNALINERSKDPAIGSFLHELETIYQEQIDGYVSAILQEYESTGGSWP